MKGTSSLERTCKTKEEYQRQNSCLNYQRRPRKPRVAATATSDAGQNGADNRLSKPRI